MTARLSLSSAAPKIQGAALWQQGFRPFFVLAAAFATLAIPLWLLILNGRLQAPTELLPAAWHAHEMLFGYTIAVVAGFLLTAAARWTGHETASGTGLAVLALVWIAGRVVNLAPSVSPVVRAVVDLSFLPLLAIGVGRPIARARSGRNYVVVVVLGVLAGANLLTHLEATGHAPGWGRRALLLATHLIVFMMLLIGGRVIPMFTRNALRDERIRSLPWLDRLSLGGMLALTVSAVWWSGTLLVALLAAACGVAVIARAYHWGGLKSRREPMLWVLHLGHAWIGVGLVCTALAPLVPVLASSATHAFTAGAIGTLTLGMMARVSLGHTGRFIVGNRGLSAAFALVSVAALVRVGAPLAALAGADYLALISLSGVLWSLAFGVFLYDTAPKLFQGRVDALAR